MEVLVEKGTAEALRSLIILAIMVVVALVQRYIEEANGLTITRTILMSKVNGIVLEVI